MAGQPGEAPIEGAEPSDPLGDLGPSLLDQFWQLRGRLAAMARMAPAGDPGRVVEREVKPAQLDQQSQVLDRGLVVLAVVVVATAGRRQPPRALVEPDRVRRDPDLASELTDAHDGSKPWRGSNVKAPGARGAARHGRVTPERGAPRRCPSAAGARPPRRS